MVPLFIRRQTNFLNICSQFNKRLSTITNNIDNLVENNINDNSDVDIITTEDQLLENELSNIKNKDIKKINVKENLLLRYNELYDFSLQKSAQRPFPA